MIRTIITPKDTDIHLSIPDNYVGKQIEVIVYTTEEASQEIQLKDRGVSLRGKLHLSDKQYDNFQQYQKDIRGEWERDI